jgi:hypothetical protein
MKYVLVKSRHKHTQLNGTVPIFKQVTNHQIFDFDYHKKIIHNVLEQHTGELLLYVTGLTPLLISVINYCRLFKIPVVLFHFNSSTQRYIPQSII